MRTIAIIGFGAIGEAVARYLDKEPAAAVGTAIVRPGRDKQARRVFGPDIVVVHEVCELSSDIDLVVDCAGHPALREHGVGILSSGIDLVTVSAGALADGELFDALAEAAQRGNAQLRVVAGAIGALDALSAGSVGKLERVTYRGRKPPQGWRGSAAEEKIDLGALSEATVHFSGNARDAALEYPKNANVAASVALAGIGFDATEVELIADPGVARNVHEIIAEGDFGRLEFRIEGNSLPDNPRSSAITAMSVVREILNPNSPIVI
ncbi:MAG: aspartate dehydrogenase [Woeseiaceae bacterium]|nr:aspartate dehydrogenase [Woeseiaceae bacterium]